MLECSFKKHLGFDCMGCGFQRSFLALFEGDFYASILLFPALIPLLLTFLLTILHLIFKFEHGAKWIVYLFAFSASLMLFNFIFKLINSLH